MKKRASTLMLHIVSLALLAGWANPALGQTPDGGAQNGWERLKALAANEELIVQRKDGREVKGRFASVSDIALALRRRGKTQEFSRADIQRVYRLEQRSARKATLIGTTIGAGAGAAWGTWAYEKGGESGEQYLIIVPALIGAGLGALTGSLIGHAKRRVLVYENT